MYLSEFDTSDSFYESRLFDALELQKINDDDGDGGGFDTDSSDGGTYSADSFSDLMPSDDQPTSSTSSHRSVDVDGRTVSRPVVAIDDSAQHEHHAPVAVSLHLLRQAVRQRSDSDVKSHRLSNGCRCSLTVLQQQPSAVNATDNASPQQRWKRLSL